MRRHKILLLLKIDAQRLFERITLRSMDYISDLSLKRTREYLEDVFKTRYYHMKTDDLVLCDEEVIINLDHFYTQVDELKWYLFHTEDMTAALEDRVNQEIDKLKPTFDTLNLYLESQLDAGSKET